MNVTYPFALDIEHHNIEMRSYLIFALKGVNNHKPNINLNVKKAFIYYTDFMDNMSYLLDVTEPIKRRNVTVPVDTP